jgi:hypothetical protein
MDRLDIIMTVRPVATPRMLADEVPKKLPLPGLARSATSVPALDSNSETEL